MKIGILGAGSWATALAKILTDSGLTLHWWIRNEHTIEVFKKRKHNPRYMESITFSLRRLRFHHRLEDMLPQVDTLLCVIPSAQAAQPFLNLNDKQLLNGKRIISATKGILPQQNILMHEFLQKEFALPIDHYATIMGPCHAEEVALEKLSYLTVASTYTSFAKEVAKALSTPYIITRTSTDIIGIQYAAVLKNIYALGAGIAHGLRYGDNFLSVYNANAQREMSAFLSKLAHYYPLPLSKTTYNYADSVYLGDLLVTCYSPYSRNREFGTLIGKGYSIRATQMEMNMTAEGYTTSKGIYQLNKKIKAIAPILQTIYEIIWTGVDVAKRFKKLEKHLH